MYLIFAYSIINSTRIVGSEGRNNKLVRQARHSLSLTPEVGFR